MISFTYSKGDARYKAILIVSLVVVGVLSLSSLAAGSAVWFSRIKETVKNIVYQNNLHCASWDSAPTGYQTAIEEAARKVGIHPAMLGAIFLSEHDDTWKVGQEKDGPYQILDFQGKWDANVRTKYSDKEDGDVNDIADSALNAAAYIKVNLEKYGPKTGETDEVTVKSAGMLYNRGPGNLQKWKEMGFPLDKAPANDTHPNWDWGATTRRSGGVGYVLRTWKNFQNLNSGCVSENSGATFKAATACNDASGSAKSTNCDVASMAIQTTKDAAKEEPFSGNMKKKTSDYAKTIKTWGLYSACSHYVAYVMRKSGADPTFPYGTVVGSQFPYIKSSGKYDLLPLSSGLKPGDILIRGRCFGPGNCTANAPKGYGHIEFYVGQNSTFPNKPFTGASIKKHGPTPQLGAQSVMGIIARLRR